MAQEQTRVIFRKLKKGGEVIAFFPDSDEPRGTIMSYMHVGQHGAAVYPHSGTVPAEDYRDLFEELTGMGYNLKVVKRLSRRV